MKFKFRLSILRKQLTVDSFLVYWLEWATSELKGPGLKPLWEPQVAAKAVHLQPVLIVLRGHPAGSHASIASNYSHCVVLGSGIA